MLEKQIEQYLVNQVKAIGGITYKFTSPARRGVPDRIAIYEGNVYFIEVKRPDGKCSPLQIMEIAKLRKHGATVLIVWCKEDVDTAIEIMKSEGDN